MYVKNTRYEVWTPDGWQDFNGVRLTGVKRLFKITTRSGKWVTATPEHKFPVGDKYIRLGDLSVGMHLDTNEGPDQIVSIEPHGENLAYDLVQVGSDHVFYVNGGVATFNCDELAFLEPNIARSFWTSLSPTLSTGGKCIITSTPNTDEDQFAEIWFGANKQVDANGNETDLGANGFKPFLAKWDAHPDRDQAWADAERASIGDDRFEREHNCCAAETTIRLQRPDGSEFDITIEEFYNRMKYRAEKRLLEEMDRRIPEAHI